MKSRCALGPSGAIHDRVICDRYLPAVGRGLSIQGSWIGSIDRSGGCVLSSGGSMPTVGAYWSTLRWRCCWNSPRSSATFAPSPPGQGSLERTVPRAGGQGSLDPYGAKPAENFARVYPVSLALGLSHVAEISVPGFRPVLERRTYGLAPLPFKERSRRRNEGRSISRSAPASP